MEVSIYVKCRFRGNPRGAGEAAAVIEYIDGTGKSHIRKQQIRIEHDTKKRLKSENLYSSDADIIKALPHYDLHSLRLYGKCLPVGLGGEMAAGRLEESERKAARQCGRLETILYADTDPHRSICRV